MRNLSILAATALAGLSALSGAARAANLNDIQTLVVIYAENRSFDNLYGTYPGANGLSKASGTSTLQLDRNGTPLTGLPAVWGGTASGITAGAPTAPVALTQAQSAAYLNQFNHPYAVGSLYQSVSSSGTNPLRYTNRDLYHRFYENQMQINGGANNMFAAWADSGGMTMGYFTRQAADMPLWNWAQRFTLADNFFQSAFGGSYLNHQYLICSCAPIYPGDGTKPINPAAPTSTSAAPTPSAVNADGVSLTLATSSPASALTGPPVFVNSSTLTNAILESGATQAVFYSINTSQPPYPPSKNSTNTSGPQTTVNLASNSTLPPQTQTTIGDLLTTANVNWAWYAGAWNFVLANPPGTNYPGYTNIPAFSTHHQPFNFFAAFDPNTTAGAANRAAHLLDAGVVTPPYTNLPSSRFLTDIQNGTLPPVTFYKPNAAVNEHSSDGDVNDGDTHMATLLAALQASPQWPNMLIVVTYDEFGGWWDHVAPPKGDRFGPGTRIPALIISPYAKKGYVDHTQYDTTSILRFITNRWNLPTLAGITRRDTALVANGYPAMGDLTGALVLP